MFAIELRVYLIILCMGKLITIVGVSGVGKTALVHALTSAYPFQTAYESHAERPFQALLKEDRRYALANQIDYLLLCAEQEKQLRASPAIGLMDSGLDLDFHGFTRLFHHRGLLTDAEFGLCGRLYSLLRETLPHPELIVHLCADERTVARRLGMRKRINIASAEDTALFHSFLEEWLASVPPDQVLELDVSDEPIDYDRSVALILDTLNKLP
jgi:deoxyadenosine/deoxycytidine kinase